MFTEPFRIVDLGVFLDRGAAEVVDDRRLPMKLRGGSAGRVRPAAMVPQSHYPDGVAS